MIRVQKLRDLTLERAEGDEHSKHISAASSLVRFRDYLYVIADDEMQLGVFPLEGSEHGYMVRILDGHLVTDADDLDTPLPLLEARLPLER